MSQRQHPADRPSGNSPSAENEPLDPAREAEALLEDARRRGSERRWRDAEESAKRCIDLSERSGNRTVLAKGLAELAWLLQGRRETEKALALYERSAAVAEEIRDTETQVATLRRWAEACQRLHRFAQARSLLERALQTATAGAARLDVLEALAFVQREQGELAHAEDALRKSLEIARSEDLQAREAELLMDISALRVRQGDPEGGIELLQESAHRWQALDVPEGECDAASRRAEVLMEVGRLSEALEVFEHAEVMARELRDPRRIAAAIRGQANVHERAERLELAAKAIERQLDCLREIDDPYEGAQALMDLARIHRLAGRGPRAQEALKSALTAARAARRPVLIARALRESGECRAESGDENAAVSDLRESARLSLDIGRTRDAALALERISFLLESHPRGPRVLAMAEDLARAPLPHSSRDPKAKSLLDRARLLLDFGRLELAREILDEALAEPDTSEELRLRASILQALGQVERSMGRPARAVEVFKDRVALERSRGEVRDLAYALNSLGATYTDLGAFSRAINAFNEALAIMKKLDDPAGIAMIQNGLANPLHFTGRSEEALQLLEHALTAQEKLGRDVDVTVTLNIRGEILRELGRIPEALADLERSFVLGEDAGDELGLSFTLPRLGRARIAAGHAEAGMDDLKMGVEIATRNPDRRQLVRALQALGDGLVQIGRREEGLRNLRRAHDIIQKLEDSHLLESVQQSLAAASGAAR